MSDDFFNIKDVQSETDDRILNLDKVGIKGLKYPISVQNKSGNYINTVGTFDMMVNLPHHIKGTHMSRFIEVLNDCGAIKINPESLTDMVHQVCTHLQADNAYIDINFPYFIEKTAPISKVKSLLDYEISLQVCRTDSTVSINCKLVVPVTSLCPCSKAISKYGAHNQRSHVTVTTTLNDTLWLEDLISMVEAQASSELYGILKRGDEKFVTERAYDNPKFVEDMVRDLAISLKEDDRIKGFTVESENFESIHNHSAYAKLSNC